MRLKDCTAHTRVKVWCNPQQRNDLRRAQTFTHYIQLPATIGGYSPLATLLVWKPGEAVLDGSFVLCCRTGHTYYAIEDAARTYGYHMGCWVDGSYDCELVSEGVSAAAPTAAVKNDIPISCKKCHTFCQYAVPNQADGVSFVCYSCRT